MLTWGDGVSNVDLERLLAFHRSHDRLATMTAVRPPARFGHLELDGDPLHRSDAEDAQAVLLPLYLTNAFSPRDIARPAPCEHEQKLSALPLPRTM